MKSVYTDIRKLIEQDDKANCYVLLDENNGCVAGCRCGVTVYRLTEYGKVDAHEDQEGFFVLSGEGMARVGEQEFEIHEGMAFLVPAGVGHTLRSISETEPLKVLWFHSAL